MDAIDRAWLSLDGLSVGDAFGEQFFFLPDKALAQISRRDVPRAPWRYTDDTEMALSIMEVLNERGRVDQDVLAARFAARMQPDRHYGPGTAKLLAGVRQGGDWRELNQARSFGNGASMRVAPLGAFFADQPLARVCGEARLSAEITHAHPEGIAGAIAVAAAAALAWQCRETKPLGRTWITAVRDVVPHGYTRDAVGEALAVAPDATIVDAVKVLGNGAGVTAPDTVPLCLWIAAYAADGFEPALWRTVSALGDRDTTCAIVGGILALGSGLDGIPVSWLQSREALPIGPNVGRTS